MHLDYNRLSPFQRQIFQELSTYLAGLSLTADEDETDNEDLLDLSIHIRQVLQKKSLYLKYDEIRQQLVALQSPLAFSEPSSRVKADGTCYPNIRWMPYFYVVEFMEGTGQVRILASRHHLRQAFQYWQLQQAPPTVPTPPGPPLPQTQPAPPPPARPPQLAQAPQSHLRTTTSLPRTKPSPQPAARQAVAVPTPPDEDTPDVLAHLKEWLNRPEKQSDPLQLDHAVRLGYYQDIAAFIRRLTVDESDKLFTDALLLTAMEANRPTMESLMAAIQTVSSGSNPLRKLQLEVRRLQLTLTYPTPTPVRGIGAAGNGHIGSFINPMMAGFSQPVLEEEPTALTIGQNRSTLLAPTG